MPIVYSKLAMQAVFQPSTVDIPTKITNWLANACNNYLCIDHWNPYNDSPRSVSCYDTRAKAYINHVPVEILGEIFMYCLTETDHQTSPLPTSLSPSSEADPQTLGEVCRFWRGVALSTPALWHKMRIYEPQRAQIQMVMMWLDRSRRCLLDVTIVQLIDRVTPKDHAATDEILAYLIAQIHRWKKIDFHFGSTVHQPLLTLPVGAPTMLESACVSAWNWEHSGTDRFWTTLHSSPSLRHAEWASYTKGLPSHVPWSQLTSISIHHGLSVEECMSLLLGCQHLVAFRVRAVWSYDSLDAPSGVLSLSRLRHLSFLGCVEATPLFNRLTLPSLVSLEIVNTQPQHFDERRSSAAFRDLLRRSSCQLKKFRFLNPDINEDDLYDYLSAPQMLSLQELTLEVPITDRIMLLLTRGSSPLLFPDLQYVSLSEIHTLDGCLSDMITSRLSPNAGVPLKFARLCIRAQEFPCDLAVFRSIMECNNWLRVFVK